MIIENEWQKFKSMCIPEDAPQVQLTEMRRAFYSGIAVFFSLTSDKAVENQTEEESDKYFKSIMTEVNEYFAVTIHEEIEKIAEDEKNGG